MSFADWKKRSEIYQRIVMGSHLFIRSDVVVVAEAAYKAGERQGRKDAELACVAALELRDKLAGRVGNLKA